MFTFAVDGPQRLGRAQVQRTVLSFFDTAGEDLTSAESVERNTRYLTSADGIILLLDPLQMRGARPLASSDALLPEQADVRDLPENVLGRVIGLLHRGQRTSGSGRIHKPIAVAFSKMDTLEEALPAHSPLLDDPPVAPYFDEVDSILVDEQIRKLLTIWQGDNLTETLRINFKRHRFFGLSALGNSPVVEPGEKKRRISHRGIQPHRVQDPFLWLMSEFGAIPKKTVKRG